MSEDVESIKDALTKNSRVLHISGTPNFVNSLKEIIKWASKGVGSGSSDALKFDFTSKNDDMKTSALQLKKLSRGELEELVLSSQKTIQRLRRQNTKLNKELERMQAQESQEKSRIRKCLDSLSNHKHEYTHTHSNRYSDKHANINQNQSETFCMETRNTTQFGETCECDQAMDRQRDSIWLES